MGLRTVLGMLLVRIQFLGRYEFSIGAMIDIRSETVSRPVFVL